MNNLDIKFRYVVFALVLALMFSLIMMFCGCAKPPVVKYIPDSKKVVIPVTLQYLEEGEWVKLPIFEWEKIKEDACLDMGYFDHINELLDKAEAKLRTCK